MPETKFDKLGPLYSAIGLEVAHIVGGNPDGAFLYVEAGDGWVGASVFKDEGQAVRYFDPSHALAELLQEVWEVEEPDKRWAIMEYVIVGSTFDASFRFPGEVKPDEEEDEDERREAALHARYGDKHVVYPPIPHH